MKSRWIGLFFVVIFSVVFAIRQYHPGTILMGWDSLHPEFNYGLAFERVFSGAWRESQGVGAVAVHSHMSELSRIATLWVIDLFVPTSAVRWTYVLLMLVLGVVGAYVLLVHILSRMRRQLGMGWVTVVAVAGYLAYLFNLSTLHHFIVPFEMFVVLFGMLPWSLWSASRYFEFPSKRRLITLLLIQFLLSPIAFAATLWVVYWGVFILTTWFLAGKKRQWIKVQILTLMVNSYWLLPTMYGLMAAGGVVESAKINQVFSPEAWLNNVAYGSVQQVARLESFILQWMNYDFGSNKFDLVVSQWVNGVNLNFAWMALNVVMGLVGVGILRWMYLSTMNKDKANRRWSGYILAGLILFTIILSRVWPISMGLEWARERLPLVGELLRTPFTKVSIFLQLIYSVLIGMGLLWVMDKVRFNLVRWMAVIVVTGVIIFPFTSWITKGNVMGNAVVTEVPKEYRSLFNFMNEQGEGRVVALPAANMWGWEYRDWGYEGAGFTQFGILQPLLVRDFDRWSSYNEGFYNEFSTALYGGKGEDVRNALQKYDVKYVLLDESVIAPGQGREILRIEETKRIALELGWKRVFSEGFLTVWDTGNLTNQLVTTPARYSFAEGDSLKTREDVVYHDLGTYVSAGGGVDYPFANLMREEVEGVEYGEKGVALISNLKLSNSQIQIQGWRVGEIVRIQYENGEPVPAYYVNGQSGPRFFGKEKPEEGKNIIYARISEGDEWREYLRNQEFEIRNQEIVIEVPTDPQIYDFEKEGKGTLGNCDVLKRGVANKSSEIYTADGRGAVCDYLVMGELDTRLSYLLRVQGDNIEGRSLKFFLYNTGSKRNDIEYLMDKHNFDQTFGLLPWSWDGYYTLNIETRSFGQSAENRVKPVEVRWFPLEQIAGAKIIGEKSENESNLKIVGVEKTGTWLYRVTVEGSGLLKLSQGYDKGWIGIESFDFAQDLRHVKVDGWANGWEVSQSGEMIIFYWPQLLECLGFVFLGVTILWIWRMHEH